MKQIGQLKQVQIALDKIATIIKECGETDFINIKLKDQQRIFDILDPLNLKSAIDDKYYYITLFDDKEIVFQFYSSLSDIDSIKDGLHDAFFKNLDGVNLKSIDNLRKHLKPKIKLEEKINMYSMKNQSIINYLYTCENYNQFLGYLDSAQEFGKINNFEKEEFKKIYEQVFF